MTKIPVDSIEIPAWIVEVCSEWYNGSGDMLYAVCSTGGLTLGNRRPLGAENTEQWYYSIWCDFSVDIGYAARSARAVANAYPDDLGYQEEADKLETAEKWVDARLDELCASYGLEDF